MQRLGIDFGLSRLGLALGAVIAAEYDTIANDQDTVKHLSDIISREAVNEVVIGRPIRSAGEAGTISPQIDRLCQQLNDVVPKVTISAVNEAYSSTQAEANLRQFGLTSAQVNARKDQYAAKIILDQYNRQFPVTIVRRDSDAI